MRFVICKVVNAASLCIVAGAPQSPRVQLCGRGKRSLQRLAALHMHEHERIWSEEEGSLCRPRLCLCLSLCLSLTRDC
ncbi:hypothetical protein CORC01_11058 [Colletotrichum orchidophilum]|uniref:Secreted protein n=1 Tax=Colletotrichum orchidophilum TaxID=1209926 RepID=A0A1G4AX18_9PEZI|nr:uncharacterized protein CORC01_11058 [Colletotrichum orchidophilum]OHE93655.1 hypothetical protein CORC01_11058 [Colletotrichum orchidophilum]